MATVASEAEAQSLAAVAASSDAFSDGSTLVGALNQSQKSLAALSNDHAVSQHHAAPATAPVGNNSAGPTGMLVHVLASYATDGAGRAAA